MKKTHYTARKKEDSDQRVHSDQTVLFAEPQLGTAASIGQPDSSHFYKAPFSFHSDQ